MAWACYYLTGVWLHQASHRLQVPRLMADGFFKDFEVRKALAWNEAIALVKIWKNKHIKEEIKYILFRACVESTLLYNATTWTETKTQEKKLDGC